MGAGAGGAGCRAIWGLLVLNQACSSSAQALPPGGTPVTPKPSPPVLPARASHPAVPCRAVAPRGERGSRSARLLGASPNPPPRFVISTRFTGGERWGEGWKGGCQRSAPARLAKKSTSLSSPAPRSRGPARPRAPRGPSPPPPYQLPSRRSHNLAKPRPDTPHGRACQPHSWRPIKPAAKITPA